MANIQRWVGQFKAPDGKKTEPKVEKLTAGGLKITTVSHKGTYLQSVGGSMMARGPVKERPGFALIAAIVETPGGPWFFKATGPEATIEHNRAAFASFVKSIGLAGTAAPKKAGASNAGDATNGKQAGS